MHFDTLLRRLLQNKGFYIFREVFGFTWAVLKIIDLYESVPYRLSHIAE